jgi:hypothetical protein
LLRVFFRIAAKDELLAWRWQDFETKSDLLANALGNAKERPDFSRYVVHFTKSSSLLLWKAMRELGATGAKTEWLPKLMQRYRIDNGWQGIPYEQHFKDEYART